MEAIKAQKVPGMLHDADIDVLVRYATQAKSDIVEIGSYKGKSAIALAQFAPDGVTVITVDPFTDYTVPDAQGRPFEYNGEMNYNAFCANLALHGVADRVEHIRLEAVKAGESFVGSVGLLFVDARHDYASVRADFEAWRGHLIDDAFVIFHDYGDEPGVTQFVDELQNGSDVEFVEHKRLCAVLRVKAISQPKKSTAKRKARRS